MRRAQWTALGLTDEDLEKPKIAIVNKRFATHFFGDRSAVGRHLGQGGGPSPALDIEIVGLVQNAKYSEVKREDFRDSIRLLSTMIASGFVVDGQRRDIVAPHATCSRALV